MTDKLSGDWQGITHVPAFRFVCGYCSTTVSSTWGWATRVLPQGHASANVRICPECNKPTFLYGGQIPGVPFGSPVQSLPKDLETLYDEARSCTAAGAYTPAVLATRKILMHIAVDKGAKEGESFQSYVEFLAEKGFVPPNGQGWVDHIRKKGNEANHEIRLMNAADAKDLLVFTEMLLRFDYEFPNRVPKPAQQP